MMVVAALFLFLVASSPAPAVDGEPLVDSGINGLIPSICLFCLDCGDRYAHRLSPRTFAWGIETPSGQVMETGERWDRRTRGALYVPSLSAEAQSGPLDRVVALIDGDPFDVSTIYVLYKGTWTNLAFLYGLPDKGARETLPIWVRIEQAPFKERPDIEDGLMLFG